VLGRWDAAVAAYQAHPLMDDVSELFTFQSRH
jgi:hypothetical protein